MKFREMSISSRTIDALEKMGYVEPTEVQEKTIPLVLEGKEVVVRSMTGSGKTAVFGVGLVELIAKNKGKIGLVIAPTRELTIQITKELTEIGRGYNMRVCAVYGGQSIGRQISTLRKGCDIIVATPGRLLDHVRRGTVNLYNTSWIVLDEADRMLDMGFKEDMDAILDETPKEKQMLLFSATIDDRIKRLAHSYMRSPEIVEVGSEDVEEIEEKTIRLSRKEKIGELVRIIKQDPTKKTIVFTATKRSVEYVCHKLNENGIRAMYLHGGKTQSQREKTMDNFKRDHFTILVATDVASRGLHIEDVGLIVNFDPPDSGDTHRHRIGRTGRMGKKGEAITFEESDPYVPGEGRGGHSRGRGSYGSGGRGGHSSHGHSSGNYGHKSSGTGEHRGKRKSWHAYVK